MKQVINRHGIQTLTFGMKEGIVNLKVGGALRLTIDLTSALDALYISPKGLFPAEDQEGDQDTSPTQCLIWKPEL